MQRLRLCCLCFPLFPEEPIWTRGRFICCCHLRSYVLSLLAALTCFLVSLAPSCHANTTNRFHINFFPHCIPPRLESSVVSSWSSFGCKACWESAGSCSVLHGTCFIFLFVLPHPMCPHVILFHFPFHHCQKGVFVRTFILFVPRPSHSLSFRLHNLCYFLMDSFSLILLSVVMYCWFYVVCFHIRKESCLVMHCLPQKRSTDDNLFLMLRGAYDNFSRITVPVAWNADLFGGSLPSYDSATDHKYALWLLSVLHNKGFAFNVKAL